MIYEIFLMLHSWVRWLVVILAVVTLFRAYRGWLGGRAWSGGDDRLGMIFGGMFDLQVLVGLILYFFVSPITTGALRNFGSAMANAGVRFFTVEHALLMIIAAIVVHIGSSMVKKETSDKGKFKKAALWYTAAIVLLLIAIPWPFLATGRPLFRFGF
jgi:hypothetical protein